MAEMARVFDSRARYQSRLSRGPDLPYPRIPIWFAALSIPVFQILVDFQNFASCCRPFAVLAAWRGVFPPNAGTSLSSHST